MLLDEVNSQDNIKSDRGNARIKRQAISSENVVETAIVVDLRAYDRVVSTYKTLFKKLYIHHVRSRVGIGSSFSIQNIPNNKKSAQNLAFIFAFPVGLTKPMHVFR